MMVKYLGMVKYLRTQLPYIQKGIHKIKKRKIKIKVNGIKKKVPCPITLFKTTLVITPGE